MPASDCGDQAAAEPESCDGPDLAGASCTSLGFQGGVLSCSSSCTFDMSGCDGGCGNGRLEGAEECEANSMLAGESCQSLGFASGELACGPGCRYDTSDCVASIPVSDCGDFTAQPDEDCDGLDLKRETCASLGLGWGVLLCRDNCTFDTDGCGDL